MKEKEQPEDQLSMKGSSCRNLYLQCLLKTPFHTFYFKITINEMTLPNSMFLLHFEVDREVMPILLTLVLFSMYVI